MVALVSTVAYLGLEARAVEVQCQIAPGLPKFNVVGLPDKAVGESRERVHAALAAMGLALPPKRITINLSPADLPKEGSHYDLPIALGLMAAIGAIPSDALSGFSVLGELGLDGSIAPVAGVLPAAIGANARDEGLICPAACGAAASSGPLCCCRTCRWRACWARWHAWWAPPRSATASKCCGKLMRMRCTGPPWSGAAAWSCRCWVCTA